MPDTITEFDALDELIEALGAVSEGDRTLDIRIEYCLGVALGGHVDVAGMLINEGVSWETVSETLDGRVPPYTTSLDAAIEGENIEFVVRSARRGQWGAMNRTRYLQEVLAWAATEPLARRLAALKGRREDLLKDRERRARDAEAERTMPVSAPEAGIASAAERTADAATAPENVPPTSGRFASPQNGHREAADGRTEIPTREEFMPDSPRYFVTTHADDAKEPEEQDWKVLF